MRRWIETSRWCWKRWFLWVRAFFTKPLPGRVRIWCKVHVSCQAVCWRRPSRPWGVSLGPGKRQKFQSSHESWPTWKQFSTNGTARTQWECERVGRWGQLQKPSMLSWRGAFSELAIFWFSGSRLWKLPSSTAPGCGLDITSLFQRKVSGLPLRQSVRPFRGWSSSVGSSRRWSTRNRESTARRMQGQVWKSAVWVVKSRLSRVSRPVQVGKRKFQKLGVHSVKRKKKRQPAAVERQLKSTEVGVEGMESERTQARRVSLEPRHFWRKRFASVTPKLPQARTTRGRQRIQRLHLQQLQKAWGGGLSVSSLGMHVLRAVATRASPLSDLVREVLRTSFTLVKASSKSVRQRDLLPLPVPWNWAPFAEFLKQSVDERRHRSSHRVWRLPRVSCTVLGAGPCWRSVC